MAERQGHPTVAAFVVLATLALTAVGAVFAVFGFSGFMVLAPDPGWGAFCSALAAVVLVSGLWLARRVSTGYWGRRPQGGSAGMARAARRGFWGRLGASATAVPVQPASRPLRPPTKRHRGGGRG